MREGSSEDRIDQFSRSGPFHPSEILGPMIARGETRVLDVGSGSGFWALEAARLGAPVVTAVERNAERVSFLAEKASGLGLANVHVVQGVAERLPVESEAYDLVIASLVLHEVNDLPEATSNIRRALTGAGRLVVVELKPTSHSHHPRIEVGVLRRLLEGQGFQVEPEDEQGDWYCLVARKGDRR